jgi:glycosyltransferase involved in cell wall biosynthesis
MKILYCIPSLEHGGAERQLSYLASELASMGHEVHVASSRGGPNLYRLRSAGVNWHCFGKSCNRDPRIFFRLIALMRKLRPDVIQTILTPMDIMGGAAALVTNTRWVLKECSSASLYDSALRYSLRFSLGRRADAIVSNSAGGDAYWHTAPRVQSFHVISNAIPLEEIGKVRSSSITRLASAPEKIVLFAGRLDANKNVENLIIALARVADEMAFIGFICGDGPQRPNLERLARRVGVSHRLIFTGYVSNLWALMIRADVFASLSRVEGCPNVVMEAMACGCPLVVSDIAAHREILNDRTACFVNPDEPGQVADAIKTTLQSRADAQARAQAGRAKAAHWGIEDMALLYEKLYLNLLGTRDTPTSHACNLFTAERNLH